MKNNFRRGQKGLTLLELLLAFAIFAIFIPSFISFARTAISNNNSIQNQANATNQLKNVFNYISADVQMSSLVKVNPTSPANCVLLLQWSNFNYPNDTIEVDYTLVSGVLTRVFSDIQFPAQNTTMVVGTNINAANTSFTWVPVPTTTSGSSSITSGSLAVNLVVTIGNANEVRQFEITPRVTQKSAQASDTISLAPFSPASVTYGSSVALTATFTTITGTVKSGTVTFLDSGNPIPIGTAPVISGSAQCTVTNLGIGVHQISAVFSGDAEYASSTTATPQTLTVTQDPSSVSLVPSPVSGMQSTPFTFTANILPSAATGTVRFTSSNSNDGLDVTISVSGSSAATTFTFPTAGARTINAAYSGDTYDLPSSGTCGVTVVYSDPVLTSISPTSCSVSPAADVPLTVNGSQFVPSVSQVWFGATQLGVTSWTANQMITSIPKGLLTAANSGVSVVVKTPGATNPSAAQPFKIIGTANNVMSQLSVYPLTNIKADNATTATLTVTAVDSAGNNVPTGGATVAITCLSGTCTLSGVTDNGHGSYTATAKSGSTGLCVFVATIGGLPVQNGGASQTQVTVVFVAGNTILVTANTNWASLTGGTSTTDPPRPGPTDLVIVSNAATLTVNSAIAVANTVILGNSSSSGNLKFNSGSQLTVNTVSAGYSSSCDVDMTNGGTLVVTTQMTTGLVLTPGTGSINFGGAGAQTLPSDITVYNNLATVGTVTATLGTSVTVNGIFNTNTGTTLDVSSNNYNLTVKGAWTNNGIFTARSSTVTLSGSSAQIVSGATIFYGLTINNSNSAGVTLSADETVTNTLTLTYGDVTTGSHTLIAYGGTNNATVTANASSYVNGNLKKYVGTGNPTVNFEVGTSANLDYTPASVAFSGVTTAGTLTVNATYGKLNSIFSGWPISTNRYVNVYWQMTSSSIAGGTYTVNLTWLNSDLLGGNGGHPINSTTLNGGQYILAWSGNLTPSARNANNTTLAGTSGSGFTTSAGFGYFVLGNSFGN
jgi:large repetitive protein